MPVTYFIADLHLSEQTPAITACLERFLQQEAHDADALYVLGDLFEAWLGDDDRTPFNEHISMLFKQLADKGVPLFFIHGNRDFLIRQSFAKRSGFTLLPEQQVIDLYGIPTLIMHGDQLCTRDVVYQKFRKKARGWWWPRLALMLPLWKRRQIAENGRKTSQANQAKLTQEIMDVTPSEVEKVMAAAGVQRLIHGHTHRPAVHELEVNGKPAQRIVLGDWYTQGSVLVVTPDNLELQTRDFSA